MPRLEKWPAEVDPSCSASEVARELLDQRLKAVLALLDDVFATDDRVEAVHQLRVWTRRAAAALSLFQPLLPDKRRRRLKKRLRRIRSRAGALRDCDIQLERLRCEKKSPHSLLKTITRARRRALRDLKKLVQRNQRGRRLKKQSHRLEAAIDGSCVQPFESFARSAISPLARDFFNASNADLSDDDALHALRIAAKRWRYALELAASALQAPWVRELYGNLGEVQDRLGAVHDQVELNKRIENHLLASNRPRQRQKLHCLLERRREELATQRAALRQWWTSARRQQLASLWQQASSLRITA